ncbi:MAG TPA: type VI secretion system tip protein VgrG [Eudoraea sp.]|nr:type VI secretion system tip protein VgrG [Eudoraea sp.]
MAKILQEQDGIISFEIKIGGAKIKDVVEVCEISVHREVNKIASATLIVSDGGPIGAVNEPFTNSEGKDFIPGNEIEIALGYGNKMETVFKGLITSQRLMVKQGKSRLIVNCRDKAVHMIYGRYNAVFQKLKDSDAIGRLAKKYQVKLNMDTTPAELPVLMQYNCSDWDFVVIRAEMNNMAVVTYNNILRIKKIDLAESPKFEINSAQFVCDIDLSLDCERLADTYTLTAWNEKEQKESEVAVHLSDTLSQGDLSAKQLSGKVNAKTLNHYSSASLSEAELKQWGTTIVDKVILNKIKGQVVVPGTADILAGTVINISDFSKRFNGKAFVSRVNHEVKEGSWMTTLFIGKAFKWHSSLEDVGEVPSSGLIPATSGVQIGKVKKIDEDPDGNFRVLVNLPAFPGPGQADGLWARLAVPYASSDAGFFFFPEIDDEVLVTFVNNDPRFPVITGALYSPKNKPKEVPDEKNQFKSIHSKSGIRIRFDDEDKILVLETPEGNSFTLDDKEKKITLKDISGNTVVMDDSGIAMDSVKDMKLTSKGDVNISATGGITIKANTDVTVDGTNIQLSAKAGFTAKGNASAEISASGQTTVKGAMVMIN